MKDLFRFSLRTRYSESAQDGIIHHSAYVIYFEVARIEFFQHMGCCINEIEKRGFLCPVIDLSIKYLKPLRSLENIDIEIAVGALSRVRFVLFYRILQQGTSVATAEISHCFINKSFKPTAIPSDILERFKSFQQSG